MTPANRPTTFGTTDPGKTARRGYALRTTRTISRSRRVRSVSRLTSTRSHIFDRVWFDGNSDGVFQDSELIVESKDRGGALFVGREEADEQRDATRQDVHVAIEESGPLRVVIKAAAPTLYKGPNDHTHGFATRIYAYAGKPYVKIDYQLQNSDKQPVYAGPLYFRSLNLNFPLRLTGDATVRIGTGDGVSSSNLGREACWSPRQPTMQFSVRQLSTSTPSTTGRWRQSRRIPRCERSHSRCDRIRTGYFWETWPNGLAGQLHPTCSPLSYFPTPALSGTPTG